MTNTNSYRFPMEKNGVRFTSQRKNLANKLKGKDNDGPQQEHTINSIQQFDDLEQKTETCQPPFPKRQSPHCQLSLLSDDQIPIQSDYPPKPTVYWTWWRAFGQTQFHRSMLFMPRFKTERELLKFPKHCGTEPLKLLLDKSRNRRSLRLQIEDEISPVNLLLDARLRPSKFSCLKIELGIGPCKWLFPKSNNFNESRPNNRRSLLTLDEGKEPVRRSLADKSSTRRFGRRKMLPGNFPCNPQPQRPRADKDEDKFAKEFGVTKSIFTEPKRSPLSFVRF
uniref:Uncharacterized protein n=1 Tax=Salix viminalis TaxID=40686 RepID=A0A6N2LT27_SALVM